MNEAILTAMFAAQIKSHILLAAFVLVIFCVLAELRWDVLVNLITILLQTLFFILVALDIYTAAVFFWR